MMIWSSRPIHSRMNFQRSFPRAPSKRVRVHRRLMARSATRLAWGFGILLVACGAPPPTDADTIVLVHGLGRSATSMLVLRTRLEGAGFRVVSFGYPSTSSTMEDLIDSLGTSVDACCANAAGAVHFVTHSMGDAWGNYLEN